jgi:uncharacterized protein with PIN domain
MDGMQRDSKENKPRVACDAMFGGVARRLRILGVDASYTPGIEDGALVEHAVAEGRVLISSDGGMFERRLLASGELPGVRVPIGLSLDEQVAFVVRTLRLVPDEPRCANCNGDLMAVQRSDVADVVPARSLIWARDFHRCTQCGQVYWRGSHWRRLDRVHAALESAANESVAKQ